MAQVAVAVQAVGHGPVPDELVQAVISPTAPAQHRRHADQLRVGVAGPLVLTQGQVLPDACLDDRPLALVPFDGQIHGRVHGHELAGMPVGLVERLSGPQAQLVLLRQGIRNEPLFYPFRRRCKGVRAQSLFHLHEPVAAAADQGQVNIWVLAEGFRRAVGMVFRARGQRHMEAAVGLLDQVVEIELEHLGQERIAGSGQPFAVQAVAPAEPDHPGQPAGVAP